MGPGPNKNINAIVIHSNFSLIHHIQFHKKLVLLNPSYKSIGMHIMATLIYWGLFFTKPNARLKPRHNTFVQWNGLNLNFLVYKITHSPWTIKLHYLTSQHKLHDYGTHSFFNKIVFKIILTFDYNWACLCHLMLNFELPLKTPIQIPILWDSQCFFLF
jgi:hypothetical protein